MSPVLARLWATNKNAPLWLAGVRRGMRLVVVEWRGFNKGSTLLGMEPTPKDHAAINSRSESDDVTGGAR